TSARDAKTQSRWLAIPLVAVLSVLHGLMPPHPGPVAAMGIFNEAAGKANMGKTILYALLVGLPTAVVAGPLFGKFVGDCVPVSLGGAAEQLTPKTPTITPPTFAIPVLTILLPVLLMLTATVTDLALLKDNLVP